jgi:hypothetical protein
MIISSVITCLSLNKLLLSLYYSTLHSTLLYYHVVIVAINTVVFYFVYDLSSEKASR